MRTGAATAVATELIGWLAIAVGVGCQEEAAGTVALAIAWVTTGWLAFGTSAAAAGSGRGAAAWTGRSRGAGAGVGRGAAATAGRGRGAAGSPLSFSWLPTSTWSGSLMALIATKRLIGTP